MKHQAFKVTATKDNNKPVAEYLFESMKEAIKFHSSMVSKGYHTELRRVVLNDS